MVRFKSFPDEMTCKHDWFQSVSFGPTNCFKHVTDAVDVGWFE